MNSDNIIITVIYYAGIASCAAQGAEKGKSENSIPILFYIKNAFGGGFIRDVIFLGVHPWLFTPSALPDLALVVIIGFLYTYYFFICKANKRQYGIALRLVTIMDTVGLGSFICIGMDKAFIYNGNIFTVIACGYITAIGGGILASQKKLTDIFDNREMIRYHIITFLGCYYYYIFRHSICLVCFIVIGFFLANIDFRNFYYSCFYIIKATNIKVLLLYPAIRNKNNNFQRYRIFKDERKLSTYPRRLKIYLIQRRIRQC